MRTQYVTVLPYDPQWPREFAKISKEISSVLKDSALAVEHVGSTSVPGLWAKPVIDLDVVVKDDGVPHAIALLEAAGYHHEGTLGIPGREAFAYTGKEHLMLHHLYICPQSSPELRRHLTFRNWLRTHPEDAAAYSLIKAQGARLYPDDIDSYCRHKEAVIAKIYAACGLEADDPST